MAGISLSFGLLRELPVAFKEMWNSHQPCECMMPCNHIFCKCSTVTSWWARWRHKSPASRLFVQPFVQAQKKKDQSSTSLAFVWGNPPVTGGFPCKGPVTRKMFPFDDVIMWGPQIYIWISQSNSGQQHQNYHSTDSPQGCARGLWKCLSVTPTRLGLCSRLEQLRQPRMILSHKK